MIVIRPLDRSDLDALIADVPARAPAMHRRRLEQHQRGEATWLIAWRDGHAVGFVGVSWNNDRDVDEMLEARGYALVEDLSVEQPHRRRGAGRALMLALEDHARAIGAPGVILDTGTSEDYAPARALYDSLGYRDLGNVFLGGWSDPDRPGVRFVDPLTTWLKRF